jgi:transcriptional regulator GlxA family with amidase domain
MGRGVREVLKSAGDDSATLSAQQVTMHRVIVVVLPYVNLLDLAGASQAFVSANYHGAAYQVLMCAPQSEVRSGQDLTLAQLRPLPEVLPDDLILIPGTSHNLAAQGTITFDPAVIAWLQTAFQTGARLASICTGAFVLGEAGLLSGRRCTTHWESVPDLQRRYPLAKVIENILFVQDGPIFTSAGIASGIDLALFLIERDYGPIMAAQVARYLVVYLRRNGTQPQASIYLAYRTHLHPGIHRAQDHLIQTAPMPTSLSELAQVADMPLRSFSRAFKEATGLTPLQYHQRLRLEVAAHLLQDSDLSIEAIAARVGFDNARHFRRLWQRIFGAAPSLSRKQGVRYDPHSNPPL